MSVLVIAQHDGERLQDVSARVLGAAMQLQSTVDVLVAGEACAAVAMQAASLAGVQRVLLADHACYANSLAENLAALVVSLAPDYSHILAPATTFGKNFIPRAAALLDMGQVSDIVAIESSDTFVRPIYAGNALATVQSADRIKLITVRGSAFERAAQNDTCAQIVSVDQVHDSGLSSFVERRVSDSERPSLESARVVVSGGRGMGGADNFALLERLAERLDAAVGASRAAVDAGYVSNDFQVGQTGKIVAPELYIAVGISGAIQHLAGMKESKVIVAINKDEEAPIFQVADYGLVADLHEVVPQLTQALE